MKKVAWSRSLLLWLLLIASRHVTRIRCQYAGKKTQTRTRIRHLVVWYLTKPCTRCGGWDKIRIGSGLRVSLSRTAESSKIKTPNAENPRLASMAWAISMNDINEHEEYAFQNFKFTFLVNWSRRRQDVKNILHWDQIRTIFYSVVSNSCVRKN